MITFPNSSRLLKGDIVFLDAETAVVQRIIESTASDSIDILLSTGMRRKYDCDTKSES